MDRVKFLMEKLQCTEQEARQVIADDARIDKGEKLFEQTPDQKKASKQAKNVGRVPGVYKFDKKERKPDPIKGKLIGDLLDGIPYAEQVEILNPEREFTFHHKGKKYKVVLSAPRS